MSQVILRTGRRDRVGFRHWRVHPDGEGEAVAGLPDGEPVFQVEPWLGWEARPGAVGVGAILSQATPEGTTAVAELWHPKCNRTALGIWKAIEDPRYHPAGSVPPHRHDSHYPNADGIGHGAGYRYPHDDRRGRFEQDYLPEHLAGIKYYEPSEHGHKVQIPDGRRRRRGDQRRP